MLRTLINNLKETADKLAANGTLADQMMVPDTDAEIDLPGMKNQYIKQVLFQQYRIKTHTNLNRTVLYSERYASDYTEANGIIFDSDWNVLAVPMWAPFSATMSDIQSNMDQNNYYLYEIQDGTIVNLYHHDGAWCIGTRKGIDLSHVKLNNKTYREMIDECLIFNSGKFFTQDEIEVDDETLQQMQRDKAEITMQKFFWDLLKPDHTYTIGFRHPSQHLFVSNNLDAFDIWFVQSVSIPTWNRADADRLNFGVCEINHHLPIRSQVDISHKITSFRALYKLAFESLHNFMNEPNNKPIFGFILRSHDHAVTMKSSCVLLESRLWLHIKDVLYDIDYETKIVLRSPEIKDKMKYLLLKRFLSKPSLVDRDELMRLFRAHYGLFIDFDTKLDLICCQLLSYNSHRVESSHSELVELLYKELTASTNPHRIEIGSKTDTNLVKQMISQEKYMPMLYKKLYDGSPLVG